MASFALCAERLRRIKRASHMEGVGEFSMHQFPLAWGERERGGYDPLAIFERSGYFAPKARPKKRESTIGFSLFWYG